MKHMTRDEAVHRRVLQRARTVAIIGASSNPARHSYTVASYLKAAGYDVIPIRPDRGEVAELPTYARLADVAGSVDVVVIFRRPAAVSAHQPTRRAMRPSVRRQLALAESRAIE